MSTPSTAILGLRAETSLHAGAGQQTGSIDLPIQREAHTGWPCVYGSGVKGALRSLAEERMGDQEQSTIKLVFGPDTANASEHAGAIAVGDARLLLLPVRSLTGHFKWVSCPAALDRLARDARRLGIGPLAELPIDPPADAAEGLSAAWQASAEGELFLEEYRFQARQHPALGALIPRIARLSDDPDSFARQLERQLIIVDDDIFKSFCDSATPVNPHVRLDAETKTVKPGALWYEESLPPETLLYVPLGARAARKHEKDDTGKTQGPKLSARQVLEVVTQQLFNGHPYLQLGGNETLGMGWCRVQPIMPEEAH